MNTLQDVREAQQMWERKFTGAGREGIVLSSGKSGSLFSLLGYIINKAKGLGAANGNTLKDGFQPV